MLGVRDNEEVVWREEWEVPVGERRDEGVGSPVRVGKGKEKRRVSSGLGVKS